jgi:hypothetical protein
MHAKLARRGHTNLRRFTWASTAEQLLDLYTSLVDA